MFASLRQFLESEHSLKMMNLAKLNLETSDFQEIFMDANEEEDQNIESLANKIAKFFHKTEIEIIPEIPEEDRDALLYVSGCFARQISKVGSSEIISRPHELKFSEAIFGRN